RNVSHWCRALDDAPPISDLAELELDRGGATEDQRRHGRAALFVSDFLDHAVEVVERTVDGADHLARLEQHLRTRLLDAFLDAVQARKSPRPASSREDHVC